MEGHLGNNPGLIVIVQLPHQGVLGDDPKDVKSSWAPQGTPTGESASSRGSDPELTASGSENPGGVGGYCLCTMVITPKLTAPLGFEASSS